MITKRDFETVHAKPCAACTIRLGRLEPTAPVMLKHEHCQAVLTQGLRIIATHPEFRFAIMGAHLPGSSLPPIGVVRIAARPRAKARKGSSRT